jgi:hypothetical protein
MTTTANIYLGDIELTVSGEYSPAEPDVGISQPYYDDLWVEAALVDGVDLFTGLDLVACNRLAATFVRLLDGDAAQAALLEADGQ